MHSLAERLMDHLKAGIPMVKVGGSFAVNDNTNWAMSGQKLGGVPTGKVVLLCDDTLALARFIDLALAAGHTIEPAGPENVILITPA